MEEFCEVYLVTEGKFIITQDRDGALSKDHDKFQQKLFLMKCRNFDVYNQHSLSDFSFPCVNENFTEKLPHLPKCGHNCNSD